jgi:hypothetical protein
MQAFTNLRRSHVAARLSKKQDHEETAPELLTQRKRPETNRFRLEVDRQTKGSYTTFEAAEAAGMVIKKGHPILQVAVYDVEKSENKILTP